MASVVDFPWQTLPVLSAGDCQDAQLLRSQAFARFAFPAALAAARELLGSEISVTLGNSFLSSPPQTGESIQLVSHDDGLVVLSEVEPDLAAAALTRLLARPLRLAAPDQPLDASLRGALAALVLELVRKSARNDTFRVSTAVALPERGLSLALNVTLDGRLYRALVWLAGPAAAQSETRSRARASYASSLLLEVPLVVAQARTLASELSHLGPGDVWLSSTGWWIDPERQGRGVLCAPGSDVGLAVDVSAEQIVLGRTRIALSGMQRANMQRDSVSGADDPLDQTLAEVPVLVRVELGSISLPAAQWAELQPGDVLTLGKQLGGPVVLRAAGEVIAQGELVSVDGELGVRVTRPSARSE